MKLTTEEQQKLHNAMAKIAEFLDTEIVPNLCGTQITVDFGDMQTYCSAPYREKEFHLTVSPRGYSMRTGGLGGLSLIPSDGQHSYHSEQAGLALMREWPAAKRQLVEHVDHIKSTKSMLDSFTV